MTVKNNQTKGNRKLSRWEITSKATTIPKHSKHSVTKYFHVNEVKNSLCRVSNRVLSPIYAGITTLELLDGFIRERVDSLCAGCGWRCRCGPEWAGASASRRERGPRRARAAVSRPGASVCRVRRTCCVYSGRAPASASGGIERTRSRSARVCPHTATGAQRTRSPASTYNYRHHNFLSASLQRFS